MEYKKLGDICDIASGGTPLRSKLEYWSDGTIPWLKITNIKEKYISKANEYITQSGLDNSSAKMFSKGTVLYTIFATLGEVGILDFEASTNQAIAGIKVKDDDKLNREYLYYFLKSKKNYVNGIGRGVAQNNINMSILRNFKIPLPNLSVQNKIVNVLNRVSNVIEWRKNQISKYDELIKARFVEMFLEKGYPKLKWNDVFNTSTGKLDSNAMVSNGKYPFFTCAKEVFKINKYDFDQEALLLAGNNAQGKYDVKYYKGKFNAYQRTYVLGLKNKGSYRLFQCQLEDKLVYLQQQSLGGLTKYLTLKILSNLEFIIPPIEEQFEFENFVKQIDKSKFVDEKNLIIMCKIKRSLYYDQF